MEFFELEDFTNFSGFHPKQLNLCVFRSDKDSFALRNASVKWAEIRLLFRQDEQLLSIS
jgi:hypothetical protein